MLPYRGKRHGMLLIVLAACLVVTACQGQKLPASVVKGSHVTVAWSGVLDATNTATTAGATPGNLDVAALTRSRFAEVVEGKVQVDETFGKVRVTHRDPFTVRYDLAEPEWSDGVPVDAADLLLAWEAGSDDEAGFQAVGSGLALSDELVGFDESKRAIEVAFTQPVPDWRTALDVAVPAHVVGRLALGLDDPMEAKKAVSDAIRDHDTKALSRIAAVWNTGFALKPGHAPASRLLLSSGPYRVSEVAQRSGAQRVRLVANGAYTGAQKPTLERLDLVQTPEDARVAALGHGADVTQLTPTRENWQPIHELQRRDYHVTPSHDGTMWVLLLRVDRGLFTRPKASAAFLRAVPRNDVRSGGAGGWDDAYAGSDALLFAPGDAGYEIALEDSGFQEKLGKGGGQGTEDLLGAGLTPGTAVCVAYDSDSEFARGAVAAMTAGMAEAGWAVKDCGRPGFSPAKAATGRWDAALVRVPVTDDPAELTRRWGSDATTSLTGASDAERDDLLTRLATTTDPYDARDLRAQVEKTIVDDAIALPIAMNPLVTVTTPRMEGVTPRPGAVASLTSRAADWSLAR